MTLTSVQGHGEVEVTESLTVCMSCSGASQHLPVRVAWGAAGVHGGGVLPAASPGGPGAGQPLHLGGERRVAGVRGEQPQASQDRPGDFSQQAQVECTWCHFPLY